MSSISIEGLQSGFNGEDRSLAFLRVEHNGFEYDWQIYVPPGENLQEYIESKQSSIYAEIEAKEIIWNQLSPKTKEIDNSITGEKFTVDIEKGEIVKPDIPDYYAKRRAEYPPIGNQMDALWKGGQAATDMLNKTNEIKAKYPKP